MARELISFRDFKGLLLDVPHASIAGSGKTGRATNFRVKDGSLVGLQTECGDTLNLSTGVTYTHSGTGAGRTLGRISEMFACEDPTPTYSAGYLIVCGQGDGLGGASGGVVAIPVYSDQVAALGGALGVLNGGWPLIESQPSEASFLVAGNFLYIGGGSSLFRWEIGNPASSAKTSHAAGVDTGPPANAKILGAYGSRMWVLTGALRVYFSNVEDLTNGFVATTGMWPTANFIDLPAIGKAEVAHTGIATPDGLAVFTNRSIRLIYDSDNGFNTVVDPDQGAFKGSLAQQGDMIYGLNERGIFRTNGRLPAETLTDEAMGDWFSANSIDQNDAVCGAIYDGSYWVTFTPRSGMPSDLTGRLTLEFNLTTGEIMWHGSPMNARQMVVFPALPGFNEVNGGPAPIPSQMIGVRGTSSQAAGLGGSAWWTSTDAVAFAGLKGSAGMAAETHACQYAAPLMLEERELRVQRIAVHGADPAYRGVVGNTIGRVLDDLLPTAWWRLGETSGAAVDSIAARNGTVSGNPVRNVTGALTGGGDTNGAIDLDGTGDFVTVPYAAALNPSRWTLAGWFKRDADTGLRETIVSNRGVVANYATRIAARSGIVAHWRMISVTGGGSAANAISGSYTGTFGASATLGASLLFAETGGSLNVNGNTAAGMTVAYNAAINPTNDFTFEVWAQAANTTGTQTIYDCINGNTGFRIQTVSGVLQLQFGTGAAIVTINSGVTLVAGRKYHIGFLCDSGGGRILYLNGTQVGSDSSSFSRNTAAASWFGRTVAGTNAFSGLISEASLTVPTVNDPNWSGVDYARGAYGSESGWAVSINEDDQIEVFVSTGTSPTVRRVTATYTTGTWRHIAVRYDGTYIRVFIDGVMVTAMVAIGSANGLAAVGTLTANTTGAFVMGQSPSGNYNTYLNGVLDEMMLFSRALSQTEIALLCDVTNGSIAWATRALKVRLIDLLDPNWTGPTFTLAWKRGTWSSDRPTDRAFARISGFRARSLAVQLIGYSGAQIDRIDVEINRLSRRHP